MRALTRKKWNKYENNNSQIVKNNKEETDHFSSKLTGDDLQRNLTDEDLLRNPTDDDL